MYGKLGRKFKALCHRSLSLSSYSSSKGHQILNERRVGKRRKQPCRQLHSFRLSIYYLALCKGERTGEKITNHAGPADVTCT